MNEFLIEFRGDVILTTEDVWPDGALAAAGYKIPAGLFADIGHPDNCDCACHRLNSPLIASDCPCGPCANPQATEVAP